MRRYYLAPVIGAGTEDDPYRPKVALYPVAWTAQIASGAEGRPLQSQAIVEVDADDFAALDADPELIDVTT